MPERKDNEVYVILGEEDPQFPEASAQERAGAAPSHGAIARRAYDLFLARGAWHGGDVRDWLVAECELKGLEGPRPSSSRAAG